MTAASARRALRLEALLLGVLLLAPACGREAPVRGEADGTPFPHPDDYARPERHGPHAAREGAACWRCHAATEAGDGGEGPVAGEGPTCGSCHPAYPHVRGDFFRGSVHGPRWQADGATCAACHGEEGRRAPAEREAGACVACHATYPHPEGWVAPDGHGEATLARAGTAACGACHEISREARTGFCKSCHPSWPHPSGWVDPAVHGAAYLATRGGCGTACHAPDAHGTPTCGSCHGLFPHPADWTRAHADVTQQRGVASCEGCHGDGSARGPSLPVSCRTACHGTAP